LYGAAGITVGLVAGRWVCPLVKSIWTPSWTLFSTGVVAILLGMLYHVCDVMRAQRWTFSFAVMGTNSILLYTLSAYYRWRFFEIGEKLLGRSIFAGPYAPVLRSAAFAIALWLIAYALYRLKLFVKI
jgi:heparan-alpha-glucosaminide N-acetyltransferase